MADKLFLFPPRFSDPAVYEVDFARPRPAVAALLGPDHPGCPLLILDSDSSSPPGIAVQHASNGRRYIADSLQIGRYMAATYGVASPHP